MSQDSSKEREILMAMRKVLAQIIKDTTPEHRSMIHPLSKETIQDIRVCLGLITARERELADAAGVAQERPYFTDEPPQEKVVSFDQIGNRRNKADN